MSRDHNPKAFPLWAAPDHVQSGMDLRDWFAGMALQGICAGLSAQDPTSPETAPRAWDRFAFNHAAKDAYHIADAMLAERAKGGER